MPPDSRLGWAGCVYGTPGTFISLERRLLSTVVPNVNTLSKATVRNFWQNKHVLKIDYTLLYKWNIEKYLELDQAHLY